MREKLIFVIFSALLLLPWSAGMALADDPGVADTCRVTCLDLTLPGQQVVVEVSVYNDEALGGIVVPLVFGQPSLDVVCDSVSLAGTRIEGAEILGTKIDTTNYKLLFYALFTSSDLSAGDGIVANLYFTTGPNWDSTLCVQIDSAFYPPTTVLEFSPRSSGLALHPKFKKGCLGSGIPPVPELIAPQNQAFVCSPDTFLFFWSKSGQNLSYTLQYARDSLFTTGLVTVSGLADTFRFVPISRGTYYWHVKTSNLCGKNGSYQDQPYSFYAYRIGDVTNDGIVELGDIVQLISYVYKAGSPPIPPESGDVTHDSLIDLSDVVYMISYLYKNGPAPYCP